MPKVTVYNVSGAQVGELELAETVFGIRTKRSCFAQCCCCSTSMLNAQALTKLKDAPKYAAAVVNLGNKKVLAVLVKVAFAPRNGLAAVSYSDRLHAATASNFLRKFVV